MRNKLALALVVFSAVTGISCATLEHKVDNTVSDIDSCIPPDASKELFSAAGKFLEQTLVCDVEGAVTPSSLVTDLPACAAAAIPAIENSLGPEGADFVTCALTKIKNDPNALAKRKARAGAMLARRTRR